MSRGLPKELTETIVSDYRTHDGDSGSPDVQAALLSHRIAGLTKHVQVHKGDHHTRLGLIKLVERRKRLLNYLKREDFDRYKALADRLNRAGFRV